MTLLRDLNALHQHRELLWIWTLREIKVRYKQSLLGAAWAVLQPLALMVVFTTVFSVLVQIPSDGVPYPVFSYTALLAWTFFASAVSFAIPSLVNNLNLVVRAPDGTVFVGNSAQPGMTNFDSKNNLELVHIPQAAAGDYRVQVIGSNVASGPQPFALVIRGVL